MYCEKCGAMLTDRAAFCGACGQRQTAPPARRVGFSPLINDPAFKRYIKNSNRWSVIFSLILAVIAVVGFYIYGATGSEMENPQALYIGLGIGGMFLLIAFLQVLGRKRSRTWDGTVADKAIKHKQRRKYYGGDNDYYIQKYTEYEVIVRADNGKLHSLVAEDDTTMFEYYQIGDRVRHHAGLNSYEKYDKSRDTFLPCAACATLNEPDQEFCFRCNCPLLKQEKIKSCGRRKPQLL